MKAVKKLNRYFKKYTGTLLLGTLFLTAANFFLIWIPVLIRETMDEIEQLGDPGVTSEQVYDNLYTVMFNSDAGVILAWNSLLLIGTVALYGILLFATRQTLIVTSRKIEYDIRNDVMEKLLALPQKYFSEHSSGETYVRATEDINKVRDYFGPVFMYTINTVTRAGFIITMMIIVNPRLTLWALIPLPLLSIFAYWISGYINKYQTVIQEQYSNIAGLAGEVFSSIRLIKAYNRERYEQQRFDSESESYRVKKLRLDMVESMFHPSLNLLIGISILIVIWQGGYMVIEGDITIGNIAEFIIYVAYLTWPVAALGYTVNRLQTSLASWTRIDDLLTEPVEINDESAHVGHLKKLTGRIEFRGVSFCYPGSSEYAIRDINMVIPAGEQVAIVGRTGAGKSTLVQLIPRLFDPSEGEILIDGMDIRNWPVSHIRKQIGFVPQDTFLFSTTLFENIAFGTVNADQSMVENASDKAMILDNVLDFEKKFETMVGERGITLSGGQKQRTALARALIGNPKILILDDSLSAVDTNTENVILQHLQDDKKSRTTIMISHRISTIKDADTIYYLESGSLIEKGTHEELLELGGNYANMYRKQLLEQELENI